MLQSSFSKFVPFGSPMPKSGISKFSAKVGDTRIRVLSVGEEDFFIARTHYLKGVGSFHCFEGSCCQACADAPEGESNTSERAILPIAVASPSLNGGVGIDFSYLALPVTKYEQLVSLNNNVGDITTYDILIQCTDEGFQKYTFLPLLGQTSFITPDRQNDVVSFLNRYRAEIHKTLGKDMNETTFATARAKALAGAAQSVGLTFAPNPTANRTFANPTPQPMPALPQVKTVAPQPQLVTTPEVVVAPVVETPQPTPTGVVVQTQVTPTVAPQVVPPIVEVQAQPVVEPQPTVVESVPTPTVEAPTADFDWDDFMANN